MEEVTGKMIRAFSIRRTVIWSSIILVGLCHLASCSRKGDIWHAAQNGDIAGLKEIVLRAEGDRSVLLVDDKGNTPLHYAAEHGHLDAVTFLIENGADQETRNVEGKTALDLAMQRRNHGIARVMRVYRLCQAAQDGDVVLITKLLAEGVSAEGTTSDGLRPIHYAAMYGQTDAIRCLVDEGVEIDALHVFDWAVFLCRELDFKHPVSDPHGATALMEAVRGKHSEAVALLLDSGAEIDKRNLYGETAIFVAVQVNSGEMVDLLRRYRADINAQDRVGNTPLMQAVKEGRAEIVNQLLASGADINVQNASGNTALHYAAVMDRQDIAAVLLDNKASINMRNGAGKTPLFLAVEKENCSMAAYLLSQGADANLEDNSGVTPSDLAGKSGSPEIRQLFP